MSDTLDLDIPIPAVSEPAAGADSGVTQPVRRVARVLIDTDVPHLGRVFDYAVPDTLERRVVPGVVVRVPLANRRVNGWVMECGEESGYSGRLREIHRVVSDVVVVTEQMVAVAKDLAKRCAAPLSTLIAAMVEDRHAAAEKRYFSSGTDDDGENTGVGEHRDSEAVVVKAGEANPGALSDQWMAYPRARAFIDHLATGQNPRAVWQMMPGTYPLAARFPAQCEHSRDGRGHEAPSHPQCRHPLSDIVAATVASQRRVLIVTPTARDVEVVAEVLTRDCPALSARMMTRETTPAERYTAFLDGLYGTAEVIVGTRSAVYRPVRDLGCIVIIDPGSDHFDDPQSPYLDALTVAVRRAHVEGVAFVSASTAMSVATWQLVGSGWAHALTPQSSVLRTQSAIVDIFDDIDRDQDGAAGHGRIPPRINTAIRRALDRGPVIVQVGGRGWFCVIRCASCAARARCAHCTGPLSADAAGHMECGWCGRDNPSFTCRQCGGQRWRSTRVGVERTARDFGRAFPRARIIAADATTTIDRVEPRAHTLVVATPGCEPVVSGGYVLGAILDTHTIASRPELWAPEEAMRRWLDVWRLVSSAGRLHIVGVDDPVLAGALVRRDPTGFAQRLLAERETLGFFPARCMIAIDADTQELTSFLDHHNWPEGCEVLGVAQRRGRDVARALGDDVSRALLRCSWSCMETVCEDLRATRAARSAKHAALLSVRINPREML